MGRTLPFRSARPGCNVCYCTVRENVVVCVTAPDVALTVTVEVPAATGAGEMDGVLEALHPPSVSMMASSDRLPPQILRYFSALLRLVHIGKRHANPMGNRALALAI
jgi:hypothetical protein